MAFDGVLEDEELHHIGPGKRLRGEHRRNAGCERHDIYKALPLIARGERRMQFAPRRPLRQRREMQRDLHELALSPGADSRREERLVRQSTIAVHLGLMLVRELEGVGAIRTGEPMLATAPLHHVDELASAAAIALYTLNGDPEVGRQQPGVDQWPDQADCRSRVASRNSDEARGANRRRLVGGELRKAIDPARAHAMRRAAVEHAGARVGDHGDRLARRLVGQAEDRDIDLVQKAPALVIVLAALRVDADELDIVATAQTGADLQASRAVLTVDEDRWPAHPLSPASAQGSIDHRVTTGN